MALRPGVQTVFRLFSGPIFQFPHFPMSGLRLRDINGAGHWVGHWFGHQRGAGQHSHVGRLTRQNATKQDRVDVAAAEHDSNPFAVRLRAVLY